MSELLLCPFCGGKAELWRAAHNPDRAAWIACMGRCSVLVSKEHKTDADAIAAWNRRVPSAEESAMRDQIRDLLTKAQARYDAMPPHEKALHDEAQRNSLIRGLGGQGPLPTPIADAVAGAYRAGAEAMRDTCAREADCQCAGRDAVLSAKTSADRWRACGRDPCAAIEAAAIRALPLRTAPEEGG